MQLRAKRNIVGGFLCMLFVGEVNVGFSNGLFTPVGFVVLLLLYFFYFQLLDALIIRYKLSNASAVLMNFALYSVLITGLLHGEIADYVVHPNNNIITTLIRIQCSLFPIFVYQMLRQWKGNKNAVTVNVYQAVFYFVCYILLLSPTKTFGAQRLYNTFITTPGYTFLFIVLAIASIAIALSLRIREAKQFELPSSLLYGLFVVSIVPLLPAFFVLILLELAAAIYYARNKRFRNAPLK